MSRLKSALLFIALLWSAGSSAEPLRQIEVWKDPGCGCCGKWITHLRSNGFEVITHDTHSMAAVKGRFHVPDGLQSCHTATIDGYVIEGHVPAGDIKRLLASRAQVKGLAAPGMPQGSPGMETGAKEPFDVIAFGADGQTSTFAHH